MVLKGGGGSVGSQAEPGRVGMLHVQVFSPCIYKLLCDIYSKLLSNRSKCLIGSNNSFSIGLTVTLPHSLKHSSFLFSSIV